MSMSRSMSSPTPMPMFTQSLLTPSRCSRVFLAFIALSSIACNWRKPLPRAKDAGPPVEVVDARPGLPAARPGAPLPPSPPVVPLVEEHEPNDDREHAQPLELSVGARRGVTGSLAPPTELTAGMGADDWYLITTGAGVSPEQLRIELQGSPQTELSLDLLDGEPLKEGPPPGSKPMPFAHIDERGRGEPERVTIGVRPGQKLLVRVRGNVSSGAKPEAATYKLLLTTSPAPGGNEVEPNETPELATPVTSADLTGTLPWRGDEDFWVLNLADGLERRPSTPPGQKPLAGIKTDAILRIELKTPGATPNLRVFLLDADQEGATPEATPEAAPSPSASEVPNFRKLKLLLDLTAPKGVQELRLRNVGLPAGSARAFVGVHTQAPPTSKGSAESPRYALRLSVEPVLEDAESEPNDDCATQASTVNLSAAGEGSVAGFLWLGDSDCFKVRGGTGTRISVQLQLPGSGAECKAALEWVRSDGVDSLPVDGGTGSLQLRTRRGDALFRVQSRDNKSCFDAPYRLLVRSEAERPAP